MASHCKNHLYEPSWRPGVALLDASFDGQPFGKHSHDAFAIGVMARGVGGYQSRGSSFTFPQNSLSLMNPDQPHNGYALQGRLEYKMLYVSEAALCDLLPNRVRHGFAVLDPMDADGLVHRHFDEIAVRMANRRHHGWELAVDAVLTDVLDLVFLRYGKERAIHSGSEPSAVTQVREFLDAAAQTGLNGDAPDTTTPVTLKSLAAMVGLHPHYLLDTFRQTTGVAPYQYFVQRRIQHSVTLLARGVKPTDVAFRMGFFDQAHFVRSFKRVLGVTPRHISSV